MILGRGTAQTDEEIIAEYLRFLTERHQLQNAVVIERTRTGPGVMLQRIGKPIKDWTDEDILALYQDRAKATWAVYNVFLTFLFFRGYRRASFPLLDALQADLSRQWRTASLPYRQKIEQACKELEYPEQETSILNLLLWMLAFTRKPL